MTPQSIVAAPMAGGVTTPELVHAVSAAGAFGFLAGGYLTAERLAADIAMVREQTARFGVNLFVPSPEEVDRRAFRAYTAEVQPEADAYGLRLDPAPVTDDDGWSEKLALLLDDPVPAVSLTFALPSAREIAELRRVGTRVWATVTNHDETQAAHRVGVDGLIVQGASAGGHSATHDPRRDPHPIPTCDLTRMIRRAVPLPLIAAGGVDGPGAVRELVSSGADAVAVGTLFLRADEAGTSSTHRDALVDRRYTTTAITRAFTGRPARALRNGFVDRHGATAPTAYPAVHHLTRELRRAAAAAGDSDRLHLWAGTGYRSAPARPAAEIVDWIARG